MPLDAEIYGHKEAIAPSLVFSTALHAALVACVLFLPAVFSHTGNDWGNNGSGGASGGAMSATLVSGIPLPPDPQAKPENVLANESKGLSQSVPHPPPNKTITPSQSLTGRASSSRLQRHRRKRPMPHPPARSPTRSLPSQRPQKKFHVKWRKLTILFHSLRWPRRGPLYYISEWQHRGRIKVRGRRQRQLRQPLRLVHRRSGKKGS